jgi:hypothetical protein
MTNSIDILMKRLHESILDPNFYIASHSIASEIEKCDNASDAIEPILRLMECYPDVHYGNPGSLVHFIEKYHKKGYEEKLIESLFRKPTVHTLWMLNRLINGSEGRKKDEYIQLLQKIANEYSIDDNTRAEAIHFYNLHA